MGGMFLYIIGAGKGVKWEMCWFPGFIYTYPGCAMQILSINMAIFGTPQYLWNG